MSEYENLEALMSEPPGGYNHGALDGNSLDTNDHQQYDLRFTGTFGIVGMNEGGTKGNRDILAPNEYVDWDELKSMAEKELGVEPGEIERLYSAKKLKAHLLPRRAEVDAKILHVYTAGGNMYQFALAIGMNTRTLTRALNRAKQAYWAEIQALQATRKGNRDNA